MKRVRKITLLCLAMVFLIALTVWAADRCSYKMSPFSGTKGFIGVNMYSPYSYEVRQNACIVNSKNKKVLNWKDHKHSKQYKAKKGGYIYYYPYRFNMGKLGTGKYRLVINRGYDSYSIPFTYARRPYLKYHSSKVIRLNNGDLVQRFKFYRSNAKGKKLHFQIFNNKNKMVYSRTVKSGGSDKMYWFNWNGWPGKNAANRCPRGVYRLKYWYDGVSPKVVNFRLAL